MKKLLLVCAAALALVVGSTTKAEAVVTLNLHICQGVTCLDFGPSPTIIGSGLNIIVGDYSVTFAGGATIEGAAFSQSQTVSLQVQRIDDPGADSALPLDVWLQATGYLLPTGASLTLDTTLAASSAPTNPGAFISYQAWLSTLNLGGFPPVGSVATALIGCNPIDVGTGPGSCGASGAPVVIAPAAVPFSLVTRTTFNIPIVDSLIYGSTGQATVTSTPFQDNPIPEPMSLLLLGSGLLGIGATTRRRRLKK